MNRHTSNNNDSNNEPPIEPSNRRAVTFDTVEIIELPFTLGDNPSVSHGAPLTTEWNAQQRTILNLEAYEVDRSHSRRPAVDLVVSRVTREALLLRHGFSQGEISDAAFEAARLKSIRKKQSRGRLSPPIPSSSSSSSSSEPQRLSSTVLTTAISGRSEENANSEQQLPSQKKPAQNHLKDCRWDTAKAERDGGMCLPQHKRHVHRMQRQLKDDLASVPIPLHSAMTSPTSPARKKSKSLSPVRQRRHEKAIDPSLLTIGHSIVLD
jgi:hypothetical protein